MSDLEDIPAETPLSPDEAIIRRHRREKKELQGKILALKKTVTKNDKKKKKELAEEIAKMEEDLETRHKAELDAFRPQREKLDSEEDVKAEKEKTDEEGNLAESKTDSGDEQKGGKMSKAQKRREKKAAQEKERQLRVEQETAVLLEGADWKAEDEKLVEILSALSLQVYEIPSDGHCLYRAVCHQLSHHNESLSIEELRSRTAQYLMEHKADFIHYLDNVDPDSDNFEAYCSKIENTAAWGGDVELKAISQILKRPIRVVQANGPSITFGEEFDREVLTLTYHRHKLKLGAHYNSVVPNS
jgi:OTU domain-containing protein 6